MEAETLEICVMDEVAFGDTFTALPAVDMRSPFFQPGFKFTMGNDAEWAPAQSRAPSVTIEFDLFESGY